MASVADLVTPQRVRHLAGPAELDTGTACADGRGVRFSGFGPVRVKGMGVTSQTTPSTNRMIVAPTGYPPSGPCAADIVTTPAQSPVGVPIATWGDGSAPS